MTEPGTMEQTLQPSADAGWILHADGYDALRETSIGSRFAISNGFLGIRGTRAMTRGARWVVPPRTYVAGLFDTPGTGSDSPGLVPAADWLNVRIMLPGGPLVYPK
jgi:trehalose/maltose hydrolase-like predicted phosphorylase